MTRKKSKELHLTPRELRLLRRKDLENLDCVRFIVSRHRTLSVLVPYDQWMEMNRILSSMTQSSAKTHPAGNVED